jgi:hypothetical protein
MYLAGGKDFAERFIFFWRSPLYGLWVGIFYLISGYDERICFYLEKYASMFLLSLAIAYLGNRLFDTQTGLLMGIWTLNCKYLVIETNGSHVIAAALFAISLLSLTFGDHRRRLPIATLALLLSTQVRSEMWVPFIVVTIILFALALKNWRIKKRAAPIINWGGKRYWMACISVGIGLFLLINLRLGTPEPHRLSEAFAMNFAMNYVDRQHLQRTTAAGEFDWMKVWVTALPGVSSSAEAIQRDRGEIHPVTALKKYPGEVLSHIGYNLKLFLRALPATFLAFDRPVLMFLVFTAYLLFSGLLRRDNKYFGNWKEIPADAKVFLAVWSLAILSLILISFVLRVVARYYIQLMPALIAFALLCLNLSINLACLRFKRVSRQSTGDS